MAIVKTLVVAGGGGGGNSQGGYSGGRATGGGGAGGLVLNTAFIVTDTSYSITVGGGGASAVNGSNSVFNTITAVGGGKGGSAGGSGFSGGSGGGAGRNSLVFGAGTVGQGNDGGIGATSTATNAGAGGGGGKGAVGEAGTTSVGGDGGVGLESSISGSAVHYGGGGGGARGIGGGGAGGLGGGGDGASAEGEGTAGAANTGGGGGGSYTATVGDEAGGAGGSGIVIISYATDGSDGVDNSSTGGTITTSGDQTIHTFTSDGTFTASVIPNAWLSGWDKRIKLTISKTEIDSTLTHFPVAVILSAHAGNCVFTELGSSANQNKIVFTKADGTTELYAEIERFDFVLRRAIFHVSKSDWVVSSLIDTDIYLYYDKTHADNTTSIGAIGSTVGQLVWDSNFVAVHHLIDDTDTTVLDSTGNIDGNKLALNQPQQRYGVAGLGQLFGDTHNILPANSNANSVYDDFTTEIFALPTDWQNVDTEATTGTDALNASFLLNAKWYTTASGYAGQGIAVADNCITVAEYADNYVPPVLVHSVDIYEWVHIAVTTVARRTNLYIEGAFVRQGLLSAKTRIYSSFQTGTGLGYTGLGNYVGFADEFRLSNIVRTDEWIKATNSSMTNVLIAFGPEEHAESSFDLTKAKRLKLTIDYTKIDSDLTHFPVTVILSATQAEEVFTELGADHRRRQIAFVQDDESTELFCEIETFDFTNKKAVFHVSRAGWVISSTVDTDFYLYYDFLQNDNINVGDVGSVQAESVWDSGFMFVSHLSKDPSSTAPQMIDSTSNSNDGVSGGTMTSDDLVTGKVGDGISFDGIDDYIDTGCNMSGFNDFTALIIQKYIATTDASCTISNDGDGFDSSWRILVYNAKISLNVQDGVDIQINHEGLTDVETTNYHAVSYVKSGDQHSLYVDGALDGSAETLTQTPNDNDILIGRRVSEILQNPANFVGDEVRLSNTARSAAWIKATYNSLFDTLLVYHPEDVVEVPFLAGWKYRNKITIDSSKVDSLLEHFPVKIFISKLTGIKELLPYLNTADKIKKVAFTKEDGVTQLFAELERYGNVPSNIFIDPFQTNLHEYVNETSHITSYYSFDIVDVTTNLTGTPLNNSWKATAVGSQRISIDYGEKKLAGRIYYENYHSYGGATDVGAKNFTLWGSNDIDSFIEVGYGIDTGWEQIQTEFSFFNIHSDGDTADPHYMDIYPEKYYRFYSIKFVDNYGHSTNIGFKRFKIESFRNDIAIFNVSAENWAIRDNKDTDFYMYYDGGKADNTEFIGDIGSDQGKAVWDPSYATVHHLVDDDNSTVLDSTGNVDGSKYLASRPPQVYSEESVAQNFDGGDEEIRATTAYMNQIENNFTIELSSHPDGSQFVKTESITSSDGSSLKHIVESANGGNSDAGFGVTQGYNCISCIEHGNNFVPPVLVHAHASYIKSFVDYAVVVENKRSKLLISGVFVRQGLRSERSNVLAPFRYNNGIGSHAGFVNGFDGKIGHFRMSSIARLESWLKVAYESDNDSLLTFSAQEENLSIGGNVVFFGANF